MKKKNKIPTIIGILILLVGTFAGVFFLQKNQVFKIGADATEMPKDVRTSNLTDTSATISWVTESATTNFINWGKSQQSLGSLENESETNQKFVTHSITLTGLEPVTNYYFQINSEGNTYDNNGLPWQFTTGPQLSVNQNSIPVSGSVITSSGQPSKRAIVYVTVDGYILSTLTSDEGNFFLQLNGVRGSDLKSIAKIDITKTLLNVSVQSQNRETSLAQIFPQSANPIPPLVLGQSKDYRSLKPSQSGDNPNVDLNLPTDATEGSKFDISSGSGTTKPTSIILESVTEGEVITTDVPEFFGKGPAGETITVTVHSEELPAQTIKIPKNGSWSYSPSTQLSEGPHSITVSWIDASGITRFLTRNFVVQAGEVPAFVSTPSGSTPTPKATPTLTPKASPTPTLKATPTIKPTATATPSATLKPTSTPKPIPVTGTLTPTLLLSIMGIMVLAFSIFVWKISEN